MIQPVQRKEKLLTSRVAGIREQRNPSEGWVVVPQKLDLSSSVRAYSPEMKTGLREVTPEVVPLFGVPIEHPLKLDGGAL